MLVRRNLFRVSLSAALAALACVVGCGESMPATPTVSVPAEVEASDTSQDDATEDFVETVKGLRERGDLEAAAKAAYTAMIQDPENPEVKLLLAELEAARGNNQAAIEISESIALGSGFAQPAVELRVDLLCKLGRESEAADAILEAIRAGRDLPQWRHASWALLTRVGRRQEASMLAESLCREGLATTDELLSLVNRNRSFPTPKMLSGDDGTFEPNASRRFSAGLGLARWHHGRTEFSRALAELKTNYRDGFGGAAAADALFGRLLAETQDWDAFRSWNVNVTESTKEFSDYWAALGVFFNDNRRHEAAARALLEAIRIDPTDRITIQRLSGVLFALGREEDGEQFKHLGIEIAQTERHARTVYRSRPAPDAVKRLAQLSVELGRPFETLAWTLQMVPAGAVPVRQEIARRRRSLLRDDEVLTMAAESALLGLALSDFEISAEDRRLLTADTVRAKSEVVAREIAATPRLVNRADEQGLRFQWYTDAETDLVSIPIHESVGGGIAVLDYDLDGWPDVYLAQGSGDPPTDRCTRSSELFRNESSAFRPTTDFANTDDYHYSSGLAAGDINQDGFPDLYLGSLGHNRLLMNNGDGTFRDASESLGTDPDRFTTSLAIADINGDSLPDLYESNYIEMEGGFALPSADDEGRLVAPTPLSHYAASDRWFENLGDGKLTVHEIDRSVAKPGTALAIVITDFKSDGKNEVFVANDGRPNHFLVQSGNNEFLNAADTFGLANGFDGAANGCMGVATGDFNRDGRLDLQVANYSQEPANLYLQRSAGDFIDQSARYGLADPTRPLVGFGVKALDIDRNGFHDFVVANGHIFDMRHFGEPFKMPPQMLMSDGNGLRLVEVEDESGYWQQLSLGRAIAMLDYDRDGNTDFLISHLDQPHALLHNETTCDGGWLQIELIGTASERDAIGAKLVLSIGDSELTDWVTAGDGYFCSDEPYVGFACESSAQSADLTVNWPSGLQQTFLGIRPRQRYLVVEGQELAVERSP